MSALQALEAFQLREGVLLCKPSTQVICEHCPILTGDDSLTEIWMHSGIVGAAVVIT